MLLANRLLPDACVVDRAIIHLLDNRLGKLHLQKSELFLDDDLTRFITTHVTKSMGKGIRALFPADRTESLAWTSVEPLFYDPANEFVDRSHQLAGRLFSLMNRKTIKAGTLWFVTFHERASGSRGLAIMKMDDSPAVVYETRADGQLSSVSVRPHALPREKDLDKAAFIVPENDCLPECHLRVIDRRGQADDVAKFFMEFLGCRPTNDAKTSTRSFIQTTDKWIKANERALDESQLLAYAKESKRALIATRNEIDVAEAAGIIFGDAHPGLRESFVETVTEALGDAVFDVDPRVQTKYRTRRLIVSRGDRNIAITGDWEAVDEMITREPLPDGTFRLVINGATVVEE